MAAPPPATPYLQISKKTWKDSARAFQCCWSPSRSHGGFKELARQGYTTVEDLADRCDSPEEARNHGPRELDFTECNHGFTAQSTAFTAMRLLEAVRPLESLTTSSCWSGGMASGGVAGGDAAVP